MILKLIEPEPKQKVQKENKYRVSWKCVDAPTDRIRGINWTSKEEIIKTSNNLIDLNMPSDIEELHSNECKATIHRIMHSAGLIS